MDIVPVLLGHMCMKLVVLEISLIISDVIPMKLEEGKKGILIYCCAVSI